MRISDSTLTQARLKELVSYDPDTGIFSWLVGRHGRKVGSSAGYTSARGYTVISIDDIQYTAHRLAVLYMTGSWPKLDTDHKNGIKTDNRWGNLRQASRSENRQNLSRAQGRTASNRLGVYRGGRDDRWVAQIALNGKKHHIGTFDTPEEAHAAYVAKKRQIHEFCTI